MAEGTRVCSVNWLSGADKDTKLPLDRMIRIDIARFNGENPVEWLSNTDQFFAAYDMYDTQRITIAMVYMDGPALNWYMWMCDNHNLSTWDNFKEALLQRFAPSLSHALKREEFDDKKLNIERVQLIEQNHMLLDENQKLSEEASHAKELASAADAELKNLTKEVTKLSLPNARQAKELFAAQEVAISRPAGCGIRKYSENRNEGVKLGRKGRPSSRVGDVSNTLYDDTGNWNLDWDNMSMELQAMKQREADLEAALAEKEILEEEYCRKFDESKNREAAFENDLAGMWVLVAKLKKGVLSESELTVDAWSSNGLDAVDQKENKDKFDFQDSEAYMFDFSILLISTPIQTCSEVSESSVVTRRLPIIPTGFSKALSII